MEYFGPLLKEDGQDPETRPEYIFKDRHGYRWRFTNDYLVTGPVPRDELTPIELEIKRYRERGYPEDEDSAPGYLRAKELVVGEWYQIENYGGGHSFKAKYLRAAEYNTSYFTTKYGGTYVITTSRIKPVDRISDWYVSGPIPADVIPPTELQARKEEDIRRAADVDSLPPGP